MSNNVGTLSPLVNVPSGGLHQVYQSNDINRFDVSLAGTSSDLTFNRYQDSLGQIQTQVMTISRSTGNVGIGTSTPSSKLHLYGSASGNAIRLQGDPNGHRIDIFNNSGSTGNFGLQIARRNDADNGWVRFYELGNSENNIPHVWYDLTGTERMRMNSVGNVGIGSANPQEKLQVNGNVIVGSNSSNSYNNIKMGGGNSFGYVFGSFPGVADGINISYNHYYDSLGVIRYVNTGTGAFNSAIQVSYGEIKLKTGLQDTAPATRMVVDRVGNVGIGIANPSTRLDISNNMRIRSSRLNTDPRPLVSVTPVEGEIRGSDGSIGANHGFLRLSAGGGSNSTSQAGIDISGFSVNTDMNNNIVMYTNDNERMRITSAGNVGINTATPLNPLHVNSTSAVLDSSRGIRLGDATDYAYLNYVKPVSGTEYLSIQTVKENVGSNRNIVLGANGGNVGIGTTTPAKSLHVLSGSNPLRLETSNAGCFVEFFNNSPTERLAFIGPNSAASKQFQFVNESDNDGSFLFRTRTGGTFGNRMIILNNGNVGIGTASPTESLTISKIYLNPNPNVQSHGIRLTTNIGDGFGVGIFNRVPANTTVNTSDLVFTTSGNTSAEQIERMVIKGSSNPTGGNVGIGTTDPGAKLHVDQSILISGTSERGLFFRPGFVDTEKYNMSILVDPVIGNGDGLSMNAFGGINFSTGSNTRNSRMIINSAGNVGIGTATPNETLHVEGSIRSNGVSIESQAQGSNSLTFTQNQSPTNSAELGYISFRGRTPNAVSRRGALILSRSEQTWTDSSCPAFLSFATTPSGQVSEVTRMTILGNGNVGIGTANPAHLLQVHQDKFGVASTDSSYSILATKDGGSDDNTRIVLSGVNRTNFGGGIEYITANSGVNNNHRFINGSNELMRITSAGNVGIGTNNPSGRLHISNNQGGQFGSLILDSNISSVYSAKFELTDSGVDFSIISNIRGFRWLTGGTPIERMRLTPAGNLGIGTATPATQLVVQQVSDGNVGTNGITLRGLNGKEFGMSYLSTSGLNIVEDRSATRVTILPGGNVGIGQTNPQSRLRVDGNPSTSSEKTVVRIQGAATSGDSIQQGQSLLTLVDQSGSTGNMKGIGFARTVNANMVAGIQHSVIGGGGGNLDFYTSAAGQDDILSLTMRLGGNGNVGIGTATPNTNLHVWSKVTSGSYSATSGIRVGENSGANTGFMNLGWRSDGGPASWGYIQTNFNNIDNSNLVLQPSSGNVGIGITNPVTKLDVMSNLRIRSSRLNTDPRPPISILPIDGEIRGSDSSIGSNHGFLRLCAGGGSNSTSQAGIDISGFSMNADMNNNIALYTNDQERMRITSGGNVGIGTSDPGTSRLFVSGTLGTSSNLSFTSGSSTIVVGPAGTSLAPRRNFLNIESQINTERILRIRRGGDNPTHAGLMISNFDADNYLFRTSEGGSLRLDHLNASQYELHGNFGANLLSITNTGNVGIGTIVPESKINIVPNSTHLSGWFKTLKVCGPSDISSMIEANNTAIGLHDDNKALYFMVNGTGDNFRSESWTSSVKMIINQNGNVGIGTIVPVGKLDVRGNISVPFTILSSGTSQNTEGIIINGQQAYTRIVSSYYDTVTTRDVLDLQPAGSSGSNIILRSGVGANGVRPERMRINSAGNVGIGTIAPVDRIHIGGGNARIESTANDYSLYLHGAGGSGDVQGRTFINMHHFGVSSINDNSPVIPFGDATPTAQIGLEQEGTSGWIGNITFRTKGVSEKNGAVFERMRITSAGNVGIGTNNPTSRFMVVDNGQASLRIASFNGQPIGTNSWNSGDVFGQIQFGGVGNLGGFQQYPASIVALADSNITTGGSLNQDVSGRLEFRTFPNTSGLSSDQAIPVTRMTIKNNGNVGIGTTDPSHALSVVGSINFTGSILQNGVPFESGASQWTTSGSNIHYTLGDVGIGTISPNAKLSVLGVVSIMSNGDFSDSLQFLQRKTPLSTNELGYVDFRGLSPNAVNNRGAVIVGVAGQAWTNTSTPGQIHFNTTPVGSLNDLTRMTISSAGNVGIGTTNPLTSLHINSPTPVLDATKGIRLGDAVDFAYINYIKPGGGTLEYLSIQAIQDANAVRRNIVLNPQGGNVGIGVSDPTSNLHVSGSSSRFDGFNMFMGSVGNVAQDINSVYFGNNFDAPLTGKFRKTGNFAQQLWMDTSTGSIIFRNTPATGTAGNNITWNDRVTITSSGNVGIGVSAPTSILHVSGDVRSTNTASAWANFDGALTTPVIRSSHNVTSVTRTSVGRYTINFSTQLSNTNYGIVASGNQFVSGLSGRFITAPFNIKSTASFNIQCGTYQSNDDFDQVSVIVMGN